jgi:hypothetical protein
MEAEGDVLPRVCQPWARLPDPSLNQPIPQGSYFVKALDNLKIDSKLIGGFCAAALIVILVAALGYQRSSLIGTAG